MFILGLYGKKMLVDNRKNIRL